MCFGSCPAYRLEIDTDGTVRFDPPTTVRDLARAIEAIAGIERWIGTEAERDRCR